LIFSIHAPRLPSKQGDLGVFGVPSLVPNIKLVLEYTGTAYHGWQRQINSITVQGVIEEEIRTITKSMTNLIGAGRTDAGVHAKGQVANFRTTARLQPAAWQRALNSLLPVDISVVEAKQVSEKFHARFSARGKIYQYRILNRSYRSALDRLSVWHIPLRLNINAMKQAAKSLIGRHDFTAFQGSKGEAKTGQCKLKRLTIRRSEDRITVTIEADRFLQHMARTIVGTLVEVGRGKRKAQEMKQILQSRDRRLAGPTAPPQGLCLIEVKY
jgi:tRNA pseudouridine38-40 synthase